MNAHRYTLPEARLILTHVYCVGHLPDGDGWVYPWSLSIAGEPLCCRCACDEPRDLRLYVASTAEAAAWLERENAAIDAYNATESNEAAE